MGSHAMSPQWWTRAWALCALVLVAAGNNEAGIVELGSGEILSNSLSQLDCKMSSWGQWGECSAACGGGTQIRSRSILAAPKPGGKRCTPLVDSKKCNLQACERSCLVSEWSAYSRCSNCRQHRSRSVLRLSTNGRKKACGPLRQEKRCDSGACKKTGAPAVTAKPPVLLKKKKKKKTQEK